MALGIALAPLLATGIVWLVAFAIGGASETTRIGVMAVAENAASVFAVFAIALTISAVLPGAVGLSLVRRGGLLAWCAAGLVLGAAAAAALSAVGDAPMAAASGIGAVYGFGAMLFVRAVAGIRRR
ncbi:MAG: hypothetical protein AAF371_01515 [Pseudomonadota bacterium]